MDRRLRSKLGCIAIGTWQLHADAPARSSTSSYRQPYVPCSPSPRRSTVRSARVLVAHADVAGAWPSSASSEAGALSSEAGLREMAGSRRTEYANRSHRGGATAFVAAAARHV